MIAINPRRIAVAGWRREGGCDILPLHHGALRRRNHFVRRYPAALVARSAAHASLARRPGALIRPPAAATLTPDFVCFGSRRSPTAGHTQCRVSTHIINVMPDGRIFPCSDLLYLPEMQQGDVIANWLKPSPLQPHPAMPCASCEAQPWCRGNCLKNLHLAYVKGDAKYRERVTDPICELVRYLGRVIEWHDPAAWYAGASNAVRRELRDCEVYEYVEVMP